MGFSAPAELGMGAVRTARRSKRIGTKVSILLGLQFPLFLSLAKIGERRPLRKGERQRIFSSVGEHSVLPFLYLCAVPDTLLLHIPATLRRRNITVLRNSFARCYGRHLRIVSDVRLYRRVRRLGAPSVTRLHRPNRRGEHCSPKNRLILRCVGAQCAPLRGRLCRPDRYGGVRVPRPTVYQV